MISPATTPQTMRNGASPWLRLRSRSCFFTTRCAVQMMTASLATSDGWIPMDPMSSQRRAPFERGASDSVPGATVISSISTAAPRIGQASTRSRR